MRVYFYLQNKQYNDSCLVFFLPVLCYFCLFAHLWINRKYMYWSLPLVSRTELLTQGSYITWCFLGDRSVFCSNEMTLGWVSRWLLDGWDLVTPIKTEPWENLENFSPVPYNLEKRGGEDQEFKNEQELQMLIAWGLGTSHVGEQIHVQKGWLTHPNSTRGDAPVIRTLPFITLCIPSSGDLSVSFIDSLINL